MAIALFGGERPELDRGDIAHHVVDVLGPLTREHEVVDVLARRRREVVVRLVLLIGRQTGDSRELGLEAGARDAGLVPERASVVVAEHARRVRVDAHGRSDDLARVVPLVDQGLHPLTADFRAGDRVEVLELLSEVGLLLLRERPRRGSVGVPLLHHPEDVAVRHSGGRRQARMPSRTAWICASVGAWPAGSPRAARERTRW